MGSKGGNGDLPATAEGIREAVYNEMHKGVQTGLLGKGIGKDTL